IVVASALWSLAGVDTEGPVWFVAALRFPVGIGLGHLARRYGLESSILARGAFATAYFALKPVLLGP
ncbi:MAG: hypothetical protein ACYSU0_00790, partial [Planctomycetota bacterium]